MMCGFAGFWTEDVTSLDTSRALIERMAQRLAHRGPDDHGTWVEPSAGIAFGHRRLAVLDISPTGRQPMTSPSGRYRIVYNGEIYNHRELRSRLEQAGHRAWDGTSDTETLLAAIERWGLVSALQQSVGMFAFALWDNNERQLWLGRDRMGEKPVYYGRQGSTLLFGSELKALTCHPAFDRRIDPGAVTQYLKYGYVATPWSIWAGISKLEPGSVIRFRSPRENAEPAPFWSFADLVKGNHGRHDVSDADAIEALDQTLRTAVMSQMISDVPLGAFLSGGIDSSTIVALMQAVATNPVRTFSVGFAEEHYNEAVHAGHVAKHLGTDHTSLLVTPAETMEIVPGLVSTFDEPFGDKSAIPTALVAQLARRDVTVALSGDGGDELFGGYTRYTNPRAATVWRALRRLPSFARGPVTTTLNSPIGPLTDKARRSAARAFGRAVPSSSAAVAMRTAAQLGACASPRDYYEFMTSHWLPAPSVTGQINPRTLVDHLALNQQTAAEQFMAIDSVSYLLDDILVKVDRTAMRSSLETRVPLLDHRVVELAWQLPVSLKVRDGKGKWILRQVLDRYVPRSMVDRPKQGFSAPVDEWIRGPLRPWAEDLLSVDALASSGMLDPAPIRQRWQQHLAGHHNWRDSMWVVLMWQAWWQQQQPLMRTSDAPVRAHCATPSDASRT